MTKTKIRTTINVSGRHCDLCGAMEDAPHHDADHKLLVTALEEHNGKLHCQPCLGGSRWSENPPEYLLAEAARLQAEFWKALGELEAEIGCDVDGTMDLEGVTVEDLKEGSEDDEEDEDEGDDTQEVK